MRRCSFVLRSPLAFIIASAVACSGSARKAPAAAGTTRMADTLTRLYERAAADPVNGFLNRARVAAMRSALAARPGGPTAQQEYLLANEQLLAGQTRAAIASLERLRDSLQLV